MSPEEANNRYNKEYPALYARKQAAIIKGNSAEIKACRQAISTLSNMYPERFELRCEPEPPTLEERIVALEERIAALGGKP